MLNNKGAYGGAWQELAGAIHQNQVHSFFDESFADMRSFYDKIGRPNGAREEDFWEWMKEELFRARKRSLNKQEGVIQALEDSFRKKF